MRPISFIVWLAAALTIAAAGIAQAHITPPVVYLSDREAVLRMTTGAKKHFVREVKLTPEEQRAIASRWGWTPDDPFYRFYLGRDANGRIVSAVTFLTEFTIHGPMRVAVALGPDGNVRDARIIEVTEEISNWAHLLRTGGFLQQFVGLDSRGNFARAGALSQENMVQFYGEVAARLIQHGAILFDVAFLKRGEM